MRFFVCILLAAALGCGNGGADAGESRENPDVAAAETLPDLADARAEAHAPETAELSTHPDVQPFVDEGKYWLINAEPGFAFKAFEQALAADPYNAEALFGSGLASYVRSVELLAMLLTLPTQYAAYGAGPGNAAVGPESENDYMARELHRVFMYLREGFALAEQRFSQVLSPEFTWEIEKVPIYVFTRPNVVLRGKFDAGDLHLLLSANAFFLWFTELMGAQDFHSDLLTAAYSAMKLEDQGLDVLSILKLLSQMMSSDERFLGLNEEDGGPLFLAGCQHMRDVGGHLLEAFEFLEEAPVGGEGEVTRLETDSGNLVLVLSNRVDFDSQEEMEMRIAFDPSLLSISQEIIEAMTTPGEVISFAEGPAVQLGITLAFLAKLDILRFMPVQIPIDVAGLEPGQIAALLGMFLGNSLGFDFGTFSQQPAGLRMLLPLMTKVAEPVSPADYWMEWECPGETAATGLPAAAKGFICSKEAELADGPHFGGSAYAIEADGLASPLPYMVWEDPTWNGWLRVDANYLESKTGPQDFVVPDLRLTNLGVHLWLEPISGLLR
jgi:hypothetical protein